MKNYFEGIHVLADPRTRTLPLFQRFRSKIYLEALFPDHFQNAPKKHR